MPTSRWGRYPWRCTRAGSASSPRAAHSGCSAARERGFQPKVATHPQQRSAIVMLPAADPAARVRVLAEAGIVADARPGHVRLSPFFYNVQDDHVAALERLATRAGH